MQSLTPIQKELIQALSSGLTIAAAAAAAGLHRTTVHHWCRTIPEFRNAVDCARLFRVQKSGSPQESDEVHILRSFLKCDELSLGSGEALDLQEEIA